MKFILSFLLFGVAIACEDWRLEHTFDTLESFDAMAAFHTWERVFEKSYSTPAEEAHRFMIWMDSLQTVASYNSRDLTFKLRLNQFADLTPDEFRTFVHGDDGACFKRSDITNRNGVDVGDVEHLMGHMGENPMVTPAPDSVDWTTKGVVTPVKNQGQCGSCWAFSATGAIECQYAIQKGTLNSLSEQQLVDCAGATYGCFGCNGGQMTGAMRYAAHNGGLCSESSYSYTARNGNCKASSCGTKYDTNSGYNAVTPYSSTALETATAAGCVSIGIEADQTAFQHYSSGVLTGSCGTSIDHGVLTVGYGTSGSQQYWKVKNSWGVSWGSHGYIDICRNCNKNGRDGECGILMEPNVPTF